MAEATRKAKVAKEMAGCGISLRISETKWKGMGSRTLQGSEKVVNVGNEEVQQGGVAIMMSVGAKRALMVDAYQQEDHLCTTVVLVGFSPGSGHHIHLLL